MTTLNLTLPNSVQRHIQEMADRDGVPVSQFIIAAVVEKISALIAESYLCTRAERANPTEFQAILDKVLQRAPLPGDE